MQRSYKKDIRGILDRSLQVVSRGSAMSISLEILSSSASLAQHQSWIRKKEESGFKLISFSTGQSNGKPSNLLALWQKHDIEPPVPIRLEIIESALSPIQQEECLNSAVRRTICYGTLYVDGKLENVVGHRS
jgi:hypothetical protein